MRPNLKASLSHTPIDGNLINSLKLSFHPLSLENEQSRRQASCVRVYFLLFKCASLSSEWQASKLKLSLPEPSQVCPFPLSFSALRRLFSKLKEQHPFAPCVLEVLPETARALFVYSLRFAAAPYLSASRRTHSSGVGCHNESPVGLKSNTAPIVVVVGTGEG